MRAEFAAGFTKTVEIGACEDAEFFQHHVLRCRAVALGHEKCIAERPVAISTHQVEIDTVHQFQAGKGRSYVDCRDPLGQFQNAQAETAAALTGSYNIE